VTWYPEQIRQSLSHLARQKFHLQARKSLGQHFLVDPKINERIVAAINPGLDDTIIEIGPGTGLLTQHLLATPLRKLIAFELDARAVPELREAFAIEGNRFVVIEQDFLQVDLANILPPGVKGLRIAGNIPYNITSPILFKLIDERKILRDATLLIQKEVAERLTALPRTKAYGIPTVLANFFGSVELLFQVRAGAFRPVPRVDSALVRIDFEQNYFSRTNTAPPSGFEEAVFRKLVRGLFAMRRKTVRNNLKAMYPPDISLKFETGIDQRFLSARAEELSIEDFLTLAIFLNEFRQEQPIP
jgi:16S rRNA (adenine1518-N6/adenine1519-N6)-dimethyltransferase